MSRKITTEDIEYLKNNLKNIIEPIQNSMFAIEERFKPLLQNGRPGSCHPNSELSLKWYDHKNDKDNALKGLSAGLIISVSEEISTLTRRYYDLPVGSPQKTVLSHLDKGPMLYKTYWAKGIIYGSNYVRHGFEWYEKFITHELLLEKRTGGGTIKFDEIFVSNSLSQIFKGQDKDNLVALKDTGGFYYIDLLDGALDYFGVAKKLKLTELEFTLDSFTSFLSEL